jgi:hypothetical protein
MSDYDILTKWLKYDEEEVQAMLARLKIQKLEDLKLQIIAQNPTLLGVGLPGPDDLEVGVEPGGPNPMLAPGQGAPPPGMPPGPMGMKKFMDDDDDPAAGAMATTPDSGSPPMSGAANPIPEPNEDDIKKFNLEIQDFESEMDEEERDVSEEY